ncbi:MAG: acyl-CoA-binding protein, partial [Betaproteobacteria bacterium]|nr:acyl-CoA-binding protein [Betaproteobacteria bacterium]
MSLQADFDKAQADVKKLTDDPGNAAKLKLYALYKQATAGDNTDKKPGFGDMVGRAKWDAWAGVKGMS